MSCFGFFCYGYALQVRPSQKTENWHLDVIAGHHELATNKGRYRKYEHRYMKAVLCLLIAKDLIRKWYFCTLVFIFGLWWTLGHTTWHDIWLLKNLRLLKVLRSIWTMTVFFFSYTTTVDLKSIKIWWNFRLQALIEALSQKYDILFKGFSRFMQSTFPTHGLEKILSKPT